MIKKINNKFIIIASLKNKKMNDKNKKEDDFYNYNYWREVQRTQLGISANLYFVFSSAIFGFTLNFLLVNIDNVALSCPAKIILCFALVFILTSLLFYAIFTENRLKDFRKTAQLISEGKSKDEVKNLTKIIGINTWSYYNLQRYSLFIGFVISLLGFSIYLFN